MYLHAECHVDAAYAWTMAAICRVEHVATGILHVSSTVIDQVGKGRVGSLPMTAMPRKATLVI